MTKSISLDALWESATPTELVFSPDKSHLPAPTKRYLEHALALAKPAVGTASPLENRTWHKDRRCGALENARRN